MIYLSPLVYNPRYAPHNLSCGLYASEGESELDAFAEVIHIKKWRYVKGAIPHYVISILERGFAKSYGARELDAYTYADLYEKFCPHKLTKGYLIKKYKISGKFRKLLREKTFTSKELEWLELQVREKCFAKAIDKARKVRYNHSEQQGELFANVGMKDISQKGAR